MCKAVVIRIVQKVNEISSSQLMSNEPASIYLLAGVTAVGKSQISLSWAESKQSDILSCDSVAVYRGMDIGSAKPSDDEQQKVFHYGINLSEVDSVYTVGDYSKYAKNVIEKLFKEDKKFLVVGGSGFYLQSFLSPVVDKVEVEKSLTEKVNMLEEEKNTDGILLELKRLNPEGLGTLDVLNPRRVSRALIRCLASGKSLLQLNHEFNSLPPPFPGIDKKVLWLDRENEDLYERIACRTKKMLDSGLLNETQILLDRGIEKNVSAANAIGYRECIAYLKGKLNVEDLTKEINHSTRRLVSKQRKWFRKHFGEHSRVMIKKNTKIDPNQCEWVRHT